MANPFVHVELSTTDLPKAKSFYGSLFGWKLEDMSMGDMSYTMIHVDDENGIGGGMMTVPMPGMPSAWLAYVAVDDCAASTAKAKQLGAQVVRDVSEIPGYGTFSVLVDPTGAAIALWQPKS